MNDLVDEPIADPTFEELVEEFSSFVDIEPLRAFMENMGYVEEDTEDIPELISEFEEVYAGEWSTKLEYAREYADECLLAELEADSTIFQYFDYDSFARDLFISDMYSIKIPDEVVGVWVFRNV